MDFSYRNELKYYIGSKSAFLLEKSLVNFLELDQSCDGEGYHIRSLYFDSPTNLAQAEKFQGISNRNKFRLRIYNISDQCIKLEAKQKVGPYIKKRVLRITRDEAEKLIMRDYSFLSNKEGDEALLFYNNFSRNALRPVIIIDYYRTAYIKAFNNVRITLDRNISSSISFSNFFDKDLKTIPVSRQLKTVLEVKYNGWLPYAVKRLLACAVNIERAAISKYVQGRSLYLYK